MSYIIDLVDTLDYTKTNCFAHQLHHTLSKNSNVITVPLSDIHMYSRPKLIISRLKQRTLFRVAPQLQKWAQDTPINVFDQDPWEAFRDESPYKGSYTHITNHLNVRTFAVTTRWWANYLKTQGFPSEFVHMWVLPQYCDSAPNFSSRDICASFIGRLHGYRQKLFNELKQNNLNIDIQSSNLNYIEYLKALSKIQCFIHSEDFEFTIDGNYANLNVGLWIKDVEAASRGCFSIRNRGSDAETYLGEIKTVLLYDTPKEIPDLINSIKNMDPYERQHRIDSSVSYIKDSNKWVETANRLMLNT